ncbi:MAG: GNAT family N-acetyltransferase [Actinomycetota bacterium]|nr:GNAT family N-acetyltransferase [Actinomycetota bacterium]
MDIRTATLADTSAILAIYNREVLEMVTTLDLVPRTVAEQETYITSRTGGLAVLVAETGEDPSAITGFGSLSFYRDRPGYRTSVENSVYVHRDHHRSGVGSLLLSGIIEQARAHGFHAIFARIVDGQEPSVNLHRRHGYEVIGIEREVGRKFGQWRNVALMQLLL